MTIRAIPRKAIGGTIKAARLPLDIAVSLFPGDGDGTRPGASIALDRLDARIRDLAGAALGDETLRADATLRRVAADERERALRLRAAAERRSATAEEHLAETQEQADEGREQAAERARRQRATAATKRKERTQSAAQDARRRKSASAKARAKTEDVIEERADAARLEQLRRDAAALDEKADALTAEAEAQRLQDEATRRKAARKAS